MQKQKQIALNNIFEQQQVFPKCYLQLDASINTCVKNYLVANAQLKELLLLPIVDIQNKDLFLCSQLFRCVEEAIIDVYEKLASVRDYPVSDKIACLLYVNWLHVLGDDMRSPQVSAYDSLTLKLRLNNQLIDLSDNINQNRFQLRALQTQKNRLLFKKTMQLKIDAQNKRKYARIIVGSAIAGVGLIGGLVWCILHGKK